MPTLYRLIIFFAFCASGLCALSLEVLWTRMLGLVFGGTALAISTVLTVYMAGLAWGSWWGGKRAARLKQPLLAYALLEAGIGLWAILVPWLLLPLPALQRLVVLDQFPLALALSRFAMAFVILLVPTWMMGATLPILSQHFAGHSTSNGLHADIGRLYAINTWGAVLGCLLTGFVLLPQLGTSSSLYTIATLNVLVALGVWLVASRRPQSDAAANAATQPPSPTTSRAPFVAPDEQALPGDSTGQEPLPDDEADEAVASPDAVGPMKWIFGLVGVLSMSSQVAWGRVLALVVGSSFYAFVLVLASFLVGLSLGAWLGTSAIQRSRTPLRATSLLLLTTGASILGGIAVMDRLPSAFAWLVSASVATLSAHAWLLFGLKALLIMAVIFVPTCLMGALFPFVLRVCFADPKSASAVVGGMYAWNTVGAIVGSFAAGFALIPWWGSQNTLTAVVMGYGLCAAFVSWLRQRLELTQEARWQSKPWGAIAATLLCTLALIWPPTWVPKRLSMGMFRISQLLQYQRSKQGQGGQIRSFEEGRSATVTVETLGRQVALKVNGKTDASTGLDMPTQIMAGLLPMLLHGKARDGLVIGWGSGVTVGAVLQFPIQRLTAVEIEPAVVRGAKAFAEWNHKPQDDRRLTISYNDGRNYLATHTRAFDVIISEPSNPWISGVSALFTQEFFRQARARLRPGGVFCQWIQLYELSTTNIQALVGTARRVFPHAYLWSPTRAGRDSLLIATNSPSDRQTLWDLNAIERRLKRWPRVRRELQRAGMQGGLDLMVRLMAGPDALRSLTRGGPLNTDDNGLVEFTAPIELLTQRKTNGKRWLQEQSRFGLGDAANVFGLNRQEARRPELRAGLVLALLRYGATARAKKLLQRLQTEAPQAAATDYVTRLYRGLFLPQEQLERCLRKRRETTPLAVMSCGRSIGLPHVSEQLLRQWLAQPSNAPHRRLATGFWSFAQGQYQASVQALLPLTRRPRWLQRYPGLYFVLSRSYKELGIWPEAVWFQRLYLSHTRAQKHHRPSFGQGP